MAAGSRSWRNYFGREIKPVPLEALADAYRERKMIAVQYANSIIPDRVLFGSDWPVITPERWLHEFAELPFKDEVREKILLTNAKKHFGLA